MNFTARRIVRILHKLKLCTPRVIIPMDGGICSQMNFYLSGEYIALKKNIPVEFDLSWFSTNGKDMDGLQVRNFDLLKAFPHLQITIASRWKCWFYKTFFEYHRGYHTQWWNENPPLYLLGYYAPPTIPLQHFKDIFRLDPKSVLDVDEYTKYCSIPEEGSVAVHVRRGDLATRDLPYYGQASPVDYFTKAVQYILSFNPNSMFYFFSDDIIYLRTILIPQLPQNLKYEISENTADKGYVDLILISRCQHIITSKGSLGKWGALLSTRKENVVIVDKTDPKISLLNGISSSVILI